MSLRARLRPASRWAERKLSPLRAAAIKASPRDDVAMRFPLKAILLRICRLAATRRRQAETKMGAA